MMNEIIPNAKPDQDELRKLKLLRKVSNVKAEQSPQVIKYLLRRKSQDELQTPLHDCEFYSAPKKAPHYFFKTFQKVHIDPNIKLDELREEKWSILSNNYKSLIEKSRVNVGREVYEPPKPSSQPHKIQFVTRRQSIEFRLREISGGQSPTKSQQSHNQNGANSQNTPSPNLNHLKDPYYSKYKKYYEKIGIQSQEPVSVKQSQVINANPIFFIPPRSKNNRSQHSTISKGTSLSPPPKKKVLHIKMTQHNLYLKELQALCNKAHSMQSNFKKDQNLEINTTTQKVSSIQAEFTKFHDLLTTDLENMDFVEEKK